jgi:drug/metabolite transporter (DMT)-like permease
VTQARRIADRHEEARGLVLVLISAACYGTLPILAKLAYATGLKPAPLLATRFVIASVLFALLARRPAPPWRVRFKLWGLGAVFVGNAFAYFKALETVPAATVALLIYSYPVIVTLLSASFGLESITPRALGAAVLAFAGCALTAGGTMEAGPGVGFACLTALIYALYIVLGSRFAADVPAETASLHVAQACVVAYVPWAVAEGHGIPFDPRAWLTLIAIAVVPTVVALRTFLSGLARIGPARAAVLSSLEVLVTMALSLTLLGERLGPRQWAGAALILGAVAFQNLRWRDMMKTSVLRVPDPKDMP